MRHLGTALLIAFFCAIGIGSSPVETISQPSQRKPREILRQESYVKRTTLHSPDSELKTINDWLNNKIEKRLLSLHDLPYLRFFTKYTVPDGLQDIVWPTLSFVLNSTVRFNADGYSYPVIPISDTIAFIDIRNYGWDTATFDIVSDLDPYFPEPLVSHVCGSYGRLISGNMLFRADWFIAHIMDTTKQDDRGEKDLLYYTLIYGKGKEPKNADEFRNFWKVDINLIRQERLEIGTVVNKGDSGVSRHTRQLRRARTLFGYYHETRDVKTHDVDLEEQAKGKRNRIGLQDSASRDYLEDIFAKQMDAGEYITVNKRGMQVYFLTLGPKDKFKRIEAGDPGVVWDRSDKEDVRVRTAKSCITCHAVGINPSTNKIRALLLSGADLKTYSKELKREIQAFYLKNFNTLVEDDNRLYERAMKEVNGLEPIQNAVNFVELYNWYHSDVDLKQAALETGMTVERYKEQIKEGTSGRLSDLYKGFKIPRETWDSLNAGVYIQSMLHIKRLRPEQKRVEQEKSSVQSEKHEILDYLEVIRGGVPLEKGQGKVVVYLNKGAILKILRREPPWYYAEILSHGRLFEGWVHQEYVKEREKGDKRK